MSCSDCQNHLSDYIDNLLESGQQSRIEEHLVLCYSCRAVRDDLLEIVQVSRGLATHTPPPSLWARVQGAVETDHRLVGWWRRISSFEVTLRAPQLALAAGFLVILFSAAWLAFAPQAQVVNPANGGPESVRAGTVERAINEIEQRISRLESAVEMRRVAWNPDLRATFDRQMLYIDQSLAECRYGLIDKPNDDVYQDLMLGAYREKVRLLEEFAHY